MDKEINVLALIKGEERYIFFYDDENRVETLRTLGRFAADPQLSFSWYDAAVMSKKIREIAFDIESRHQQLCGQLPQARFSFRTQQDKTQGN